MVYLYCISCLRYTILARNPRYLSSQHTPREIREGNLLSSLVPWVPVVATAAVMVRKEVATRKRQREREGGGGGGEK